MTDPNINPAEQDLLAWVRRNTDSLHHALTLCAEQDEARATIYKSSVFCGLFEESGRARREMAAELMRLSDADYEANGEEG